MGVGDITLVLAGQARQLTGEPAAERAAFSTHAGLASLLSVSTHLRFASLRPNFPFTSRALVRGRRRAVFTRAHPTRVRCMSIAQPARRAFVLAGVGRGPGGTGFFLTKSETAAEMSQKQAHFVWKRNRARTTYIVNRVPREVFWRL